MKRDLKRKVSKKNVKSGKVKSGKSTILKQKHKQILLQLKQNPEGLRVETIHKLTNIPTRTIYRALEKYIEKGVVLNQYPVWKPNNGQSDFWQSLSESEDMFELHNLSYIVKLITKPDWWNKRKPSLMRLKDWQFSNHNFGKNNSNPYQQIINEDYVIQTYSESIIIIHKKRYFSTDPHEIIQQGMIETINILNFLQQRFRFNFFPSGIPSIEIRGNDFNRLKDFIAEKCKKEGTKFLVETEVGKVWVDLSEPFGKEANTPDIQETLEKVTRDHIEKKPMLNSELQSALTQNALTVGELATQMNYYGKHIVSHVEAIQTLSSAVKELQKEIKRLKNIK